jgi:hypothetical protein
MRNSKKLYLESRKALTYRVNLPESILLIENHPKRHDNRTISPRTIMAQVRKQTETALEYKKQENDINRVSKTSKNPLEPLIAHSISTIYQSSIIKLH